MKRPKYGRYRTRSSNLSFLDNNVIIVCAIKKGKERKTLNSRDVVGKLVKKGSNLRFDFALDESKCTNIIIFRLNACVILNAVDLSVR